MQKLNNTMEIHQDIHQDILKKYTIYTPPKTNMDIQNDVVFFPKGASLL